MARQMTMVGFLQAQNCTNHPYSWRHPDARTDSFSPEYYEEIGRVLERVKFQIAFFDDRLAMPDRYGGDHTHTVENGIRCVKMDPIPVLMAMAAATKRLGLGATCSATYYEPFHVARLFQTIDLMSKGRAAWNVVTSVNDGEARNMGREQSMDHDSRYDQADEFMEIVHGHWDSWDDDAVEVDRKNGRYADPAKVRRLDYKGKYMSSRGPFTVPRSDQGHPVVIQAGQSKRGRVFAARWGEVIFTSINSMISGKLRYAELKQMTAANGRDPDALKICIPVTTVTAATRAEAEDKAAVIETLPKPIDALSLLSEWNNYDFATRDIDAPMTTQEIEQLTGSHANRDSVIERSGKANPSLRDFLAHSPRGTTKEHIIGDASEVADRLEELFSGPVCDGFVVAATHVPGGYADFVDFVVPELQRRGLYWTDYTGTTLRENLGLARPAIGDWKH
ncbi:MAG: NtaA/DmoA family FMN-dependent monooxygenase [Rhodospirillales bacterium]